MSKVSVSYRLSAKVNPADKDSAWAGVEVGYEQEADGTEVSLEKVAEELIDAAKMQVITQLGFQFTQDENGSVQPVLPVSGVPTSKASKRVETSNLPVVVLNGTAYFDYRGSPQQAANARFPDFKTKDGKKDDFGKNSHWLLDKDGSTPTDFAVALEKAGLL